MICSYLRLAIVGLVAIFLAGCVSTKGLIDDPSSIQIVAVEVTKARPDMGSINLSEDLRVKTLNVAHRFSESGSPRLLRIHITHLSFKDPIKSLVVGDFDRMVAGVDLVDPASGMVEQRFETIVIANGDVNGVIGAVVSAINNPVDQEQVLAKLAARSILTRIYGGEHAHKVQNRAASRIEVANYPARYDDLKRAHYCRLEALRAENAARTERGGSVEKPKPRSC